MVVMAKSVESLLCFCWQVVLKSSSRSMVSELKERPLNKQLKAANEEAWILEWAEQTLHYSQQGLTTLTASLSQPEASLLC